VTVASAALRRGASAYELWLKRRDAMTSITAVRVGLKLITLFLPVFLPVAADHLHRCRIESSIG
jgi:hypothetical protein